MEEKLDLKDAREQLVDHSLYHAIEGPLDLRRFTEIHVFAVWDFMSLLKSLQRDLTTVSVPWVPAKDPETARLINELVLAEETDFIQEGTHRRYLSHFEWYLEAMAELGADTAPIRHWMQTVQQDPSFGHALKNANLEPGVAHFLQTTSDILDEPVAVRAAVFHHSRESLIPQMFLPIATHFKQKGLPCKMLIEYLERHIELDSTDHSLASEAMFSRLLEATPDLEERAKSLSVRALVARRDFWTYILESLEP